MAKGPLIERIANEIDQHVRSELGRLDVTELQELVAEAEASPDPTGAVLLHVLIGRTVSH